MFGLTGAEVQEVLIDAPDAEEVKGMMKGTDDPNVVLCVLIEYGEGLTFSEATGNDFLLFQELVYGIDKKMATIQTLRHTRRC